MIEFTATFPFTHQSVSTNNDTEESTVSEPACSTSYHDQFFNQLSSYANSLSLLSEQLSLSSSSSPIPVIPEGLYSSLHSWISITIPHITIQDFALLLQVLFSICKSMFSLLFIPRVFIYSYFMSTFVFAFVFVILRSSLVSPSSLLHDPSVCSVNLHRTVKDIPT